MAEPSRYTPEQLSILLRIAAGKLGRDPVKLQEELQNGRLDGLLQSLGADREKVNALLSDREGLSQLLQSPQVRMLLHHQDRLKRMAETLGMLEKRDALGKSRSELVERAQHEIDRQLEELGLDPQRTTQLPHDYRYPKN